MKWEVAGGAPCQLGESPFWHPREQRLYWIDITGKQLHRIDAQGGERESWDLPMEACSMAPAASGGLVVALADGFYRARSWGGSLQALVRFRLPARTRFNDGKADPSGRFWAGTYSARKDARLADLYSLDCRPDNGNGGKPLVQLKATNAYGSNGLAWSPDAHTLYWADTGAHLVHAWDWEAQGNAMRHHREFHRFAPKPAGWQPGDGGYGGRPDGAAADAEGYYWCAMYEGGRVLRLSPAGKIVAQLEVPARCPTMPCFGGPDLRTLYVTTVREGRPEDELSAYPDSGCVFSTRVDVPGLPVNFFID
jgi:sugar lactone lactonase YvrE